MRLLIADDEAPARSRLSRMLLEIDPTHEVIQTSNGLQALESYQHNKPDILLLDIQMPELNGIEVALELAEPPPIIFITAFDEYAVKAFELAATDYLLKPYTLERLSAALDRALCNLAQPNRLTPGGLNDLLQHLKPTAPKRILARKGERYQMINVDSIDWTCAQGNYVEIHCAKSHFLLRDTMDNFQRRLGENFVRVHRSTLVNLSSVATAEVLFKGDYQLKLYDGTELRLSRHYRDNFFSLFS